MSLERRGNNLYWYDAYRVGERIVKRYLRTGPFASNLALVLRIQRNQRLYAAAQEREALLFQQWQDREVTKLINGLTGLSFDLVSLHLEAAGYHRPKRGKWRKRWASKLQEEQMKAISAVGNGGLSIPDDPKERQALILSAVGSTDAELRKKAIFCLRQEGYDVTSNTGDDVAAVVRCLGQGDPVLEEIYRAEVRNLWREFTGTEYKSAKAKTIPFVERLLIDRIIACKLALVRAEMARENVKTAAQGAFADKHIDSTQKRYLAAIKAYAEVKRLALPMFNVAMPGAMQMNLGEKQVNLQASQQATQGASFPV